MDTTIKNNGDGLIQEINDKDEVIAIYSDEYIDMLRSIVKICESDFDPWSNPLIKST